MNDHDTDFRQLAKDANIPTTAEEINARYSEFKDQADIEITNTSAFGPFWRFVDAIATKPALWLVEFIITSVLPQAFVKTASGVMLELHAWSVDLERKLATKARGFIQFTRNDITSDVSLPAGTTVDSQPINGVVYRLVTLIDVVFDMGQATLSVECEAENVGTAYNVSEGLYSVLQSPLSDSIAASHDAQWLVSPGTNIETDEELRSRIRNQYAAVNQWHTDAVYTSIIAAFDGVSTENIYFEHNAPRGPGSANAYVMLEIGNPSDLFIDSIQSTITDDGNHGHGDDLLVFAMPESFHDVQCNVWLQIGTSETLRLEYLSAVEDLIRSAFRQTDNNAVTKVRPWSLFSFSILSLEIHTQVPAIKNISFSVSHIESAMNIPRLDDLIVAVNLE